MALVKGTEDPDHLFALGGDIIKGFSGDDDIDIGNNGGAGALAYGGTGNDQISGADGADTFYGGAGDDTLWGGVDVAQDYLFGGAGNDTLVDGDGHDVLDGGTGIDTVSLSYLSFVGVGHEAINYDFGSPEGSSVTPDGSTLISIEQLRVFGSNYDDIIKGGARNDFINGWTGNDQLFGQNGDDQIGGGNGNDMIDGGKGNDVINGNGNDDVLIGGDGDDTLIGGNIFDTFFGHDVLEGGRGADHFQSGPGPTDLVYTHSTEAVYVDLELGIGFGGEAEGDTFSGAFGTLYGSEYNDRIIAGARQMGQGGDDQLVAGYGTYEMTGGGGKDTFIFRYSPDYLTGPAHIMDFDQGLHEIISVAGIDARAKLGDQAFKFIGTDAFSGMTGELRYEVLDPGHTIVEMNIRGDVGADLIFYLDGAFTLTAADFIL